MCFLMTSLTIFPSISESIQCPFYVLELVNLYYIFTLLNFLFSNVILYGQKKNSPLPQLSNPLKVPAYYWLLMCTSRICVLVFILQSLTFFKQTQTLACLQVHSESLMRIEHATLRLIAQHKIGASKSKQDSTMTIYYPLSSSNTDKNKKRDILDASHYLSCIICQFQHYFASF